MNLMALEYRLDGKPQFRDIFAHKVIIHTRWIDSSKISVVRVEGYYVTKSGAMSKNSKGEEVRILADDTPDWLKEIIADAEKRLAA